MLYRITYKLNAGGVEYAKNKNIKPMAGGTIAIKTDKPINHKNRYKYIFNIIAALRNKHGVMVLPYIYYDVRLYKDLKKYKPIFKIYENLEKFERI